MVQPVPSVPYVNVFTMEFPGAKIQNRYLECTSFAERIWGIKFYLTVGMGCGYS